MVCNVLYIHVFKFSFFTGLSMSRGFMCPCLGKVAEDVVTLDYRHCSLEHVPPEVFNNERTLEELYLDSNLIRELPRVREFPLLQ